MIILGFKWSTIDRSIAGTSGQWPELHQDQHTGWLAGCLTPLEGNRNRNWNRNRKHATWYTDRVKLPLAVGNSSAHFSLITAGACKQKSRIFGHSTRMPISIKRDYKLSLYQLGKAACDIIELLYKKKSIVNSNKISANSIKFHFVVATRFILIFLFFFAKPRHTLRAHIWQNMCV